MRLLTRSWSLRRALPWMLLAGCLVAALGVASGARLERADFVFNNAVEITTLDPATVTGQPEGRILQAVYEGLLVKHPETLEPLPGMAASWESSPDGKVHTFHIRKNARWTNGDPVTAHDFVWSFRRVLDPATAAEYAYQLWYIRGARDFSTWPNDCWSTRQAWVRMVDPEAVPAAGEHVRIGLAPPLLREIETAPENIRALRPDAPAVVGEQLAVIRGRKSGRVLDSPVSGRVVDTNPAIAEAGQELLNNPFQDRFWCVEIELDAAGARALGQMPRGEIWRQQELWPEVGIEALDDHTLILRLEHKTPYFLDLMSFYPLFPVNRKALQAARARWPDTWQVEWIKPENIVTNGPFRVKERRINDRIRLVKNHGYWDAENVAFETIDALAVDHYGTALNLYLTGECDWLNGTIPNSLVPRLGRREDFVPAPYLGSYFYRVNVTKPPLDDPRVRRALAMAIERKEICERILKAGQTPLLGMVPPGVPRFRRETFGREDPAGARDLLGQAGYGSRGKRFPTIEIHYNTSETHRDIAEVVADGWRRHLGLDVRLLNQEWKVYLDSQANLKYDVSRSSWIGDYPDANTFLDLFVTGGENNKTGWSNTRYDELIAEARRTRQPPQRTNLLRQAEAILMDELPIIPIYAYSSQNLRNPRLGGFFENVQDVHFPKFWYWKSDEQLTRDRRSQKALEVVEAPGPVAGQYPAEPVLGSGRSLPRSLVPTPAQGQRSKPSKGKGSRQEILRNRQRRARGRPGDRRAGGRQ